MFCESNDMNDCESFSIYILSNIHFEQICKIIHQLSWQILTKTKQNAIPSNAWRTCSIRMCLRLERGANCVGTPYSGEPTPPEFVLKVENPRGGCDVTGGYPAISVYY